jgi:hypothetical protein
MCISFIICASYLATHKFNKSFLLAIKTSRTAGMDLIHLKVKKLSYSSVVLPYSLYYHSTAYNMRAVRKPAYKFTVKKKKKITFITVRNDGMCV